LVPTGTFIFKSVVYIQYIKKKSQSTCIAHTGTLLFTQNINSLQERNTNRFETIRENIQEQTYFI